MDGQGKTKGPFRSSSQAANVYHKRWRLHTVPHTAERHAGKLWISISAVFGLTRPGIKPVSTVSIADTLFIRLLIPLPPLLFCDQISFGSINRKLPNHYK